MSISCQDHFSSLFNNRNNILFKINILCHMLAKEFKKLKLHLWQAMPQNKISWLWAFINVQLTSAIVIAGGKAFFLFGVICLSSTISSCNLLSNESVSPDESDCNIKQYIMTQCTYPGGSEQTYTNSTHKHTHRERERNSTRTQRERERERDTHTHTP